MTSLTVQSRAYALAPQLRGRRIGQRAHRSPGILALGAGALSVAAALSVAVSAPSVIRVPTVFAFVCIAPGSAFVIAAGGRREPGLIVGVSLAMGAVGAQMMLWLGAWSPRALLYVLAAVCLVGLLFGLAGRPRSTIYAHRPVVTYRLASAVGRGRPTAIFHAGLLATAALLWILALSGTQLGEMGGLGLLNALPATYFLAFALLLVGFAVAAASNELDPRLLGVYVLALILVLHGTTAILYSEPRYAWVYKHLGVINLIASAGHVDRQIDIYNNWPAFFAANAWLSRTAGIAPIAYAGWAQVFFNIADVLAVRFAIRALTNEERFLWTAALFFVLGNWVGQDYLAPQAFGFTVSLVVLGLALRSGYLPISRGLGASVPLGRRRKLRLATPLRRSERERTSLVPPLSAPASLIAGGAGALAVIASHQLSPLLLIADLAVLALIARRVPLWIPVAMAAIETWWLVLAWPFLSSHFSLFDVGGSAGTGTGRDLAAALPGARLSFYAPVVVIALMLGLALLGALRRRREGRSNLVVGCLIAAPTAVVAFQSYGGEGPYRAFLFALPWLAFLGAAACTGRRLGDRPLRMRFGRLVLASTLVAACLLVAYFGQELANHIPSDDVQASTWYELHAPPGSLRVNLAPSAPDRLTARYPLVSLADPPSLLSLPQFIGHRLGPSDLPRLERFIGAHQPYANGRGNHPVFLVLTRGQENYGLLNGLTPRGSVAGLKAAVQRSRDFSLVFSRRTAWIFRYMGHRSGRGTLEKTR